MSLDKAIKQGKEWRKQYRGASLVSPQCRSHNPDNECPWCKGNRLYNTNKKLTQTNEQLQWLTEEPTE